MHIKRFGQIQVNLLVSGGCSYHIWTTTDWQHSPHCDVLVCRPMRRIRHLIGSSAVIDIGLKSPCPLCCSTYKCCIRSPHSDTRYCCCSTFTTRYIFVSLVLCTPHTIFEPLYSTFTCWWLWYTTCSHAMHIQTAVNPSSPLWATTFNVD